MDKVISKILDDVSEEFNVDRQTTELIYTDVFKFIKQKIEELDFENLNTEEDLRKAKVNFNIPRIFKLYTTPERINYAKESIRKNSAEHDKGIDACDGNKETGRV